MGWTVRGSNPGGSDILRTCPDRPCGPPSLLYNGYRTFPGGKKRPVRDADPTPPSSAVVKKIELYLYSPYGPYGLYRASVPVQYSYTSTPPMGRTASTEPQYLYSVAIPLLPLWAVRPVWASVPVQYSYTSTPPAGRTASTSLSACTRAHFTFYFLVFRMPCMSSPSVFVLHPLQQYICICNCVSIENKACICKTCTIERLPDWAPCSAEQCCWLGHWLACQLIVLKSVNNWVCGSAEQEVTHVLKLQEVPLSAILVKCWSAWN